MKRTILLVVLIVIFIFGTVYAQVGKIFRGNVAGPEPCTILENQPINYFPIISTLAFMIDSTGDGYLSDNLGLKNRIIAVSNVGCGFWKGVQSAFSITGHVFTIFSHVDDLNQPTHFFRAGASEGVWRTAKDGSSNVQINNNPAIGQGGSGFDKIRDRFVVANPGAALIHSMDRAGGNLETWVGSLLAATCAGVAVFDTGQYVLAKEDIPGNGTVRLYSGWMGALIQSQTFVGTGGSVIITVSLDNVNNEAFISDSGRLFRWVISTNIITMYVGGPAGKGPNSYYGGYIYGKPLALSAWRYSRDGTIIQTWNGSQWIH